MWVGRLRRSRLVGRVTGVARRAAAGADGAAPLGDADAAAGALETLRQVELREEALPSAAGPRLFLVRDRTAVAEDALVEAADLLPAPLRGRMRRGAPRVSEVSGTVAADLLTVSGQDRRAQLRVRAHYVAEGLTVVAQSPVRGGVDGVGNAVRAHAVVGRHAPGLAPRLVRHGRLAGGARYLVEERVDGVPVRTATGLAESAPAVLEGLARVHEGHGVGLARTGAVWGDLLAERWRRTVATRIVDPALGRHVAALIEADRRVRTSWVHGDLVASNVLRAADGRVVLLDWARSREAALVQDAATLHLFSAEPERTLAQVMEVLDRPVRRGSCTAGEELVLAHAHRISGYPERRAALEGHARADLYERQVRRQVERLVQVLDRTGAAWSVDTRGLGPPPSPEEAWAAASRADAVEGPEGRLRAALDLVVEAERLEPCLPSSGSEVTLLARDRVVRRPDLTGSVLDVLPPGQGRGWEAGAEGVRTIRAPAAADVVVLGKLDLQELPKLRAVYAREGLTLVVQPWSPTGGAGIGRAVRAHEVVGRHAPRLIPPMLAHGFLSDGTPYFVERWLPGRPLNSSRRLSEEAPRILEGLAALHRGHGTSRVRLTDHWGEELLDRWRATASTGIVPGGVDRRVQELIDRDGTVRCSFVHGDLVASNVLAHGSRVVLVDWEHAHEGVLMGDAAKLHLFGADPEALLDTILAVLGDASEQEHVGDAARDPYSAAEELALCHAQLVSLYPTRRARLAGHERAAIYEQQVRRQLERLEQVLGRVG